jgi:hypothetical protein
MIKVISIDFSMLTLCSGTGQRGLMSISTPQSGQRPSCRTTLRFNDPFPRFQEYMRVRLEIVYEWFV